MSDFEIVVDNLKTKGKALFSEKIIETDRQSFSVKQTTVVHLALFDKPESIWESPDLEILYNKMSSEYDLKIRFDILDKKIGYLSDIPKMMMEFLAEKRNAFWRR